MMRWTNYDISSAAEQNIFISKGKSIWLQHTIRWRKGKSLHILYLRNRRTLVSSFTLCLILSAGQQFPAPFGQRLYGPQSPSKYHVEEKVSQFTCRKQNTGFVITSFRGNQLHTPNARQLNTAPVHTKEQLTKDSYLFHRSLHPKYVRIENMPLCF